VTQCSLVDVHGWIGGTYCGQQATLQASYTLPVPCLAYTSTLKMKWVRACETLVNFYRVACSSILEDSTVHKICKSNTQPSSYTQFPSTFRHMVCSQPLGCRRPQMYRRAADVIQVIETFHALILPSREIYKHQCRTESIRGKLCKNE
jgi:hypothetical protein